MKERLLQFVGCPECAGAPFSVDAFLCEGEEIVAGSLLCETCDRRYPVIDGVPRLLPDDLMGMLAIHYPDFFRRWDVPVPSQVARGEVARTLTFYSFARAKLFTPVPSSALVSYWRQSLETRVPGMSDVQGGLGVDAGCGEGRYTYCLAQAGAEIIGMDLSSAVDLAYRRNRDHSKAHILQGSIYRPPFRRGILDFVMSTGVLHHLPEPQRGFASLVPLLRAGGCMHIWVYGLQQMSLVYRLSHLTFLRGLGRRLSPQASYALSLPIALALHVLLFRPVQLLARTGAARSRVPVQLRELASLPFHMHLAEVQDRIGVPITHFLTGDELRQWYEQAGLRGITIEATHGGRGWSARGCLPTTE